MPLKKQEEEGKASKRSSGKEAVMNES